jgi:type VI secretion system protein
MLFDFLLSNNADPLTLHQCIQKDLHRLFNTRRGSLQHMPDYGLPDLQTIYQSFPRGKVDFIIMVKNMINRFEPRLSDVSVEENTRNSSCIINLVILATINGSKSTKFDSYFYSEGSVKVGNELL